MSQRKGKGHDDSIYLLTDDDALPDVSLESMAASVGKPDPKLREALFLHVKDASLVARGIRVDSATIIKEGPKLLARALAIWDSLPAEKRKALRANVPAFAAVALSDLVELKALKTSFDKAVGEGSSSRGSLRAKLKRQMRDGIALRDDAYEDMGHAVGSNEELREKLDGAVGHAATPDELVAGLRGLAGVLGELVKHHRGTLGPLLDNLSLDHDRVGRLESAAAAIESTAHALSGTTPGEAVTQRQLDLQDGRALHTLDLIVRAFWSAHAKDESILVPRPRALASLVGPRQTAPKASEPAQPEKKEPTPA